MTILKKILKEILLKYQIAPFYDYKTKYVIWLFLTSYVFVLLYKF